jgi:hypothetical protein
VTTTPGKGNLTMLTPARPAPVGRGVPVDAVAAEIARFTYRPGWTFTVYHDLWLGPMLFIVAPVTDGYNPGATIDLGIKTRIPTHVLRDPEAWAGEWLLWRLTEAEIHEAREMLRRDGQLVDDPHQG